MKGLIRFKFLCIYFCLSSFGVLLGQRATTGLSASQEFALTADSQEANDLSRKFNTLYPQEIKILNKDILSPEAFFGVKIGSLHLSYEQVSSYMRYLASVSNRVLLRIDGVTYESRPFASLVISTEDNLKKVKQQEGIKSDLSTHISDDLLVNWLGYGVHGNEASGVNASVVVAYLLAAGEDTYITDILQKTIVLIVPALNPDGVSDYANWVNSNISFAVNKDELNREFKQPAPSSRSNHYWFDLNRDWLFAQHPEMRAVLKLFHEFKPHIVNDFHEHGNVSGTYFSPGVESSTYPLIDPQNWMLTNKIAEFHANYMDNIGMLYFSREGYDNFYTGKGAAYPSLANAIGILYEQPNSRGLDNFRHGVEVSLVSNIRSQIYCSFSSLVGSAYLEDDIFSYRNRVEEKTRALVAKNPNEAYVFSVDKNNISLRNEFFKILDAHNIKYYKLKNYLGKDKEIKSDSFAVPLAQEYPSIIKTIFEPQLEFVDTTFYDISTWTVPMAFNINYSKENIAHINMENLPFDPLSPTVQAVGVPQKSNYAYLFSMDDYYSYNFLYYLLDNGVFVKASDRPFSFESSSFVDGTSFTNTLNNNPSKTVDFSTGSVVIPVTHQSFGSDRLYEIICAYFLKHSFFDKAQEFENIQFSINNGKEIERGFVAKGILKVHALSSGRGVDFDLGSRKFSRVTLPSIAIIIGKGATYRSIGELWHLLDQRFRVPVTLLDHSLISASSLSRYNIVICTNNFNMNKDAQDAVADWATKSNNFFIAIRAGVSFANKSGIAQVSLKSTSSLGKSPSDDSDSSSSEGFTEDSYITKKDSRRLTYFNGVILKSLIDQSHPMSIGLSVGSVPVFKQSNYVIKEVDKSFSTYSIIDSNPLMSGYLSKNTANAIADTPYIIARKGFVFFPDNPYFRGYWLGTSRIFLNSLFFRELF